MKRQRTNGRGAIRQVSGKKRKFSLGLPSLNFRPIFSWLGKLTLVGGVLAGAWLLWPHLDRPVAEVEFAGSLERVDQQELRQQVEEVAVTGLLTLDIDELDARVEHVDWVYAAEIQKIWPQRLSITIEEEQPVARWGEGGYLTASGKMVVSEAVEDLSHLPGFDVLVADPREALDLFYGLNSAMLTTGVAIKELRQSQFGSWSMVTENGSEILLGKDELITRMKRVMRAWQRLMPVHIDELETVDARYPNGVAVKYREKIVQKNRLVNGGWET